MVLFILIVTLCRLWCQPEELVRASFYADKFEGRHMAGGGLFHQDSLVAASMKYPIGSLIYVYCPLTGKGVHVKVTDRGPWNKRYSIDLSKEAFKRLGVSTRAGWAWVTVSLAKPTNFSDGNF